MQPTDYLPSLPDFEPNLFQPSPEFETNLFYVMTALSPAVLLLKLRHSHPTGIHSMHSQHSVTPESVTSLPCPVTLHLNATGALPSSDIQKHLLRNIQDVLDENLN